GRLPLRRSLFRYTTLFRSCRTDYSERCSKDIMDILVDLANGFAHAFTLQYLLFAAIGVTFGTLVGVLPGIGPALALALLLPLTYGFDPTGALIIFAGIYYGSLYGGAITSILLNTPGEAGSVATASEGYPMAKAGRAGPALATAVAGAF